MSNNYVAGEFDSYLAEYMWRRLHKHSQKNEVFTLFLKDIVKIYPPTEKDPQEKN